MKVHNTSWTLEQHGYVHGFKALYELEYSDMDLFGFDLD
jgi:hypothetical protein